VKGVKTAVPGAEALVAGDQFRRLTELVLSCSRSDHTFLAFYDASNGTTRFANNQIVQNVHARRVSLRVTTAFGRRHGSATVTDFGEEAVRDAVRRAEEIAKVSPEDPEYVAPLPPQLYAKAATAQPETAMATPQRRLDLAQQAIELCLSDGVTAAGIVSTSAAAVGVAASSGLFAYEPRTEASFSLTATGQDSTGWAANVHRSIAELGVAERTRLAIQKAKASVDPREIRPGRYTVILEPAAMAGLIAPLVWMLDAKSFYKGTSPFSGKLGRIIMDQRLSLRNQPAHPGLLGNGFNGDGLPADDRVWIEKGVLKQLRYDRYTAQEHHVHPTPTLDAPYLFAEDAHAVPARDVEELISATERGILITNFWYIRTVNPNDLTLTGMTRDGTFWIEDGHVSGGLVNLRWHESPLRALRQIEAFTEPADAVSNEYWKMQLPTMKIRDFEFTSITRF
jgi:predicted Zn-dependent protease